MAASGESTRRVFGTDRELLAFKPEGQRYTAKDKVSKGLFLEVNPSGVKSWHYRYSLNGKQDRLVLGHYPEITLKDARNMRDDAAACVAKGVSPKADKADKKKMSFYDYGEMYYHEVVCTERADPRSMRAYLVKDIYPILSHLAMVDITVEDVRKTIWRKKEQGYDAAAKEVRGLLKRMFDYAMTLGIVPFNPVLAIPSRHVFKAVSRDRVLSTEEIKHYYTALFTSRIHRPRKLGLLLSLLTLVRKSELNNAKWEDVDLENRLWHVPVTKNTTGGKNSRSMLVYLSTQVVEIFQELKIISGDSAYVFNGRIPNQPIAHNVLNYAQKQALSLTDIPYFTIHDLRRTASTHLHEQGFHSDAIEACLNHVKTGVRGVYNKAIYQNIRIDIMQKWSDIVFSTIYEPNLVFFKQHSGADT